MLKTSKHQTDLVSALLDACRVCMQHDLKSVEQHAVAIEDTFLTIPPDIISTAASQSSNFHAGIWLLESIIMHLNTYKTDDIMVHVQKAWLQLSKLYDCLCEADMLIGVCNKASKVDRTRTALDAELRGDYRSAIEIYTQLLV
jgi:hypothetical protein